MASRQSAAPLPPGVVVGITRLIPTATAHPFPRAQLDSETFRKRPSLLIYERKLSTQERLDQTSYHGYLPEIVELVQGADGPIKDSNVPIDRPLFEPFPPEIILQAYQPFHTYEVVLKFRNMDRVCIILHSSHFTLQIFSSAKYRLHAESDWNQLRIHSFRSKASDQTLW